MTPIPHHPRADEPHPVLDAPPPYFLYANDGGGNRRMIGYLTDADRAHDLFATLKDAVSRYCGWHTVIRTDGIDDRQDALNTLFELDPCFKETTTNYYLQSVNQYDNLERYTFEANSKQTSEYETLIAAGFDDYAARCALRTDDDGGFCHAYFYSDGQWRFQTGGSDLALGTGEIVKCVLTKRLYADPR